MPLALNELAELDSAVAVAAAQDPDYWRALCPQLHVCDAAWQEAVTAAAKTADAKAKADSARRLDRQRCRMCCEGFFTLPPSALLWRQLGISPQTLADAAAMLAAVGWNANALLVFDEAWALCTFGVAPLIARFGGAKAGLVPNFDFLA